MSGILLSTQRIFLWKIKQNGLLEQMGIILIILCMLLYSVLPIENGESVFDIGDKVKLRRHVDPEVLSKVANFVLQVDDEEEREKN